MSHESASESVLMQVPDVGAFARALLPIHLTEADSLTFGVWLAIDPRNDALRRLFDIWWDDEQYANLRLTGWLANALPRWGLLNAPVTATVRDVSHTPYCDGSSDSMLSRVLSEEWDRVEILAAVDES